jgi:tryptophan synthase beta chain
MSGNKHLYRQEREEIMDKRYYGEFGGQFVSESLMNTLDTLEKEFETAIKDPEFIKDYNYYLKEYVGRENPLYFAEKLSAKYKTKIYLKREDLNHTGAHKINNVIGQVLLAKRMGKTKVIAETGAGQHGVATATVAALFGMECTVYMGKEDMDRQQLNVFRMELLGAKVQPVTSGSATLKDATNEAIRTWAERAEDTFYVIGSAVGPYPYPKMVREFQKVISVEARRQILEKEGRLPDAVVACVGGGSNSIGMFSEFINDKDVKLVGAEAGGLGVETGKHASAMALGKMGILHGMKTYLLQDDDGNIELAHSISAGLDYPGVGPEHAYLRDTGRVEYVSITDKEAMDALLELSRLEGIIPAIESAHALAQVIKMTKDMTEDQIIVMCLSGRGDKDVITVQRYLNGEETNK